MCCCAVVWCRWMSERADPLSLDSDVEWRQLARAPFSPRADVAWAISQDLDPTWRLYVVGGQTAELCGLRELSVCSDEVWVALLVVERFTASQASGEFRLLDLQWEGGSGAGGLLPTPPPTNRMPFGGRCGLASFLSNSQLLVVGGQSTATSCEEVAPYSTEVWRLSTATPANVTEWQQQRSTPFSGRRSMQREDLFTLYSTATASNVIRVAIGGGVCHLSVLYDPHTNQSTLNESLLYADVWMASLPPSGPSLCCDWSPTPSTDNVSCPTTSMPIPSAMGSVGLVQRSKYPMATARFGGILSQRAIDEWAEGTGRGSPPPPSSHNDGLVLVMARNSPRVPNLTCADLWTERRQQSLTRLLHWAELNDPLGPYRLGSSWVQSHTPWRVQLSDPLEESFTALVVHSTVHRQVHSLATTPSESTLVLPQAASSLNTTRPALQFSLARLGHRLSGWSSAPDVHREAVRAARGDSRVLPSLLWTFGQVVVSGGHSGSLYSSDWLLMTETRCLYPDDSSFALTLGPVRLMATGGEDSRLTNNQTFALGASVTVECPPSFHFEPDTDIAPTLFCAPNGLWIDDRLLALRRCVANRLHCTPPGEERNGQCSPPIPIISSIRSDRGVTSDDGLHIHGLSLQETTLRVEGRFFSNLPYPPLVLVGGEYCTEVTVVDLDESNRFAYNLTLPSAEGAVLVEEVEEVYGSGLTCSLPIVFGYNLPVTVVSGFRSLWATLGDGVGFPLVSSTPPVIAALYASNPSTECRWLPGEPLTLSQCSVFSPESLIWVCAAEGSFQSPTSLSVWLGSSPLQCSPFSTLFRQFNATASTATVFDSSCSSCVISPRLGSPLPVRLRHNGLTLESVENATVRFSACPAGYRTSLFNDSDGQLCWPCPMGYTSEIGQGSDSCQPCQPGKFSDALHSANCTDCPAGHFGNASGATHCPSCPLNSYQSRPGQDSCHLCDVNEYLLPDNSLLPPQSWSVRGQCAPCPPMVDCSGGQLLAYPGRFLLVEQGSSAVEAIPCSTSACWAGAQCQGGASDGDSGSAPQVIAGSELSLVNCCAKGRRPAYSPLDEQLLANGGVNVLCSKCLDGHSVVNGACVPCAEVNWGSLTGLLLLMALIVFSLHRLPHDWTGSGHTVILFFFVQQSAVLLTAVALPPLFSLVDLSLVDDRVDFQGLHSPTAPPSSNSSQSSTSPVDSSSDVFQCTLPMSDLQRMTAALLSPLLSFVALAALGGLQLLLFTCLSSSAMERHRQSRLLLTARGAYRWLFVVKRRTGLEAPQLTEVGHPLTSTSPLFSPPSISPSPSALEERAGAGWLGAVEGDVWPSYQRTAIRLLLLSYGIIARICLLFFHTTPVGPYGWRLAEYSDVDPRSASYQRVLPLVVTLLALVVVGLPALILMLLYHHRRQLHVEGHDWLEGRGGVSGATRLIIRQLTSMYRPTHWWMASFNLTRRLLLVLALITAPVGYTWTWVIVLHFLLLTVHLRFLPFVRPLDNQLEALSLLSLALQSVLLGLADHRSPVVLTALSLLVAVPILALCASTWRNWWRRWRLRRQTMGRWALMEEQQREALLDERSPPPHSTTLQDTAHSPRLL